MASVCHLMIIVCFFATMSSYQFSAQSPTPPPSVPISAARSLDALLQDYAYRAFGRRPRTGVQYDGSVPSSIIGVRVSVMRLRSGSLRSRGVSSFNEFEIPVGVIGRPYVRRLALVYQNLGNWSSLYYQLPGYKLVAPVLGLLAYEAANLSATNLPELDITASGEPISIKFRDLTQEASGLTTKCVWFSLNGLPQLNDSAPGNVCTANRQGHFSIAVNSSEIPAPPPAPARGQAEKSKSNTWKIVLAAIGGFLVFVLLVLLIVWLKGYRENKKMKEMVRNAEAGEMLGKHRIGDAQLPTASIARTRPILENDITSQVN